MKKTLAIACASAIFASGFAADTYQSQPTDDVWNYDNAFNAGFTAFLRAWGDGTNALDPQGLPPALNYSYSYAKWSLGTIQPGVRYRVLEAKLTVTQTTPPGYSFTVGQAFPLEARNLSPDFNEATWDYTNPNNPLPGTQIFGRGTMENYQVDAAFPITMDLLAGDADFETYFNEAIQNGGELAFAFVSTMDPGQQGGQVFYRFYSRNDAGGRGPVLSIRYAVRGDVDGDGCVNDTDLLAVLFAFGNTGGPEDLNGDGIVNDGDLLETLFNFSNGC